MDSLDQVLVIDSDPTQLASTTMLLETGGFSVVSAASVSQVAEALEPGTPRVVIIEPSLDDRDGFELCRSIIDSCPGNPPAILIASRSLRGKEWGTRAREVGAQLFIERPEQDEMLVETVGRVMRAADIPRTLTAEPEPRGGLLEESPEKFEAWLHETFTAPPAAKAPSPPNPAEPRVEPTAPPPAVAEDPPSEIEVPATPNWSQPVRRHLLSVAAGVLALITLGGGALAWLNTGGPATPSSTTAVKRTKPSKPPSRSTDVLAAGTMAHAGTFSIQSKAIAGPAASSPAPERQIELPEPVGVAVNAAAAAAEPVAVDTADAVEPAVEPPVPPQVRPPEAAATTVAVLDIGSPWVSNDLIGPPAETVQSVEAVYREARVIEKTRTEPRYPYAARQLQASGYAELRAVIGTDGFLREIEIVDEQPSKRFGFGKAAMAAAQHWRYEPATSDGNPVSSSVRLKFEFQPR